MIERDLLAERGKSLEDDYFRKRDQELIEKMRAAAAADRARAEMGQRAGIADAEVLQELQALGFTPDTVALLPLVPAVQIAWEEGGVSAAERELIVKLARSRGVEEGSAADRMLAEWMAARPSAGVLANATRLIRAMLESSESAESPESAESAGAQRLSADELVKHCESIAAASGGVLRMNRISAQERQLLTALAAQLKAR